MRRTDAIVDVEAVGRGADRNNLGAELGLWAPKEEGKSFDLSLSSMKPLDPFRKYLTIVSDTDCRMAMTGQFRRVAKESPREFDPRKFLIPAFADPRLQALGELLDHAPHVPEKNPFVAVRDHVPDSRAARADSTLPEDHLDEAVLGHVRRLNEIARGRGQKLAQLALQWVLRDPRVTSTVIGASSVEQLDTNLDALDGPSLTEEELAAVDQDAVDSGINLWAKQTEE